MADDFIMKVLIFVRNYCTVNCHEIGLLYSKVEHSSALLSCPAMWSLQNTLLILQCQEALTKAGQIVGNILLSIQNAKLNKTHYEGYSLRCFVTTTQSRVIQLDMSSLISEIISFILCLHICICGCTCAFICVHLSVGLYTYVCTCLWRSEVNFRFFLNNSIPYFSHRISN